ncbi:MAG: NUDIX hydrolase [Candidatus Levyibacteriota bacterium]
MILNTRVVTVAALAFDDNRVLLVKHGEAAHHITGVYGLPGGRLDGEEKLLDAAAREFQEETGLTADKSSMVKLGKIYEADIPRKNGELLKTSWNVFLVKKFSGELKATEETVPEWVEIDTMEKLDLLPNTYDAAQEGKKLLNTTNN